jgi:hypothetical protein
MTGGMCFNGCDCDECVRRLKGECGCDTGIGYYHARTYCNRCGTPQLQNHNCLRGVR